MKTLSVMFILVIVVSCGMDRQLECEMDLIEEVLETASREKPIHEVQSDFQTGLLARVQVCILTSGEKDLIFVSEGWSGGGSGGEENLLILSKNKEGWVEIRKLTISFS